ncbi:hypothetical protein PR048_012728 [Dryococelus australis]|uniref:Uncharacterized protein n=1 Tax=Dryococelus australis TaxID=614101 RepID=A0ABQ9HQ58_9NEOP|nr:hypothetical protein PR048_012728 [Dryococelus australis]
MAFQQPNQEKTKRHTNDEGWSYLCPYFNLVTIDKDHAVLPWAGSEERNTLHDGRSEVVVTSQSSHAEDWRVGGPCSGVHAGREHSSGDQHENRREDEKCGANQNVASTRQLASIPTLCSVVVAGIYCLLDH